ncbi:MAG: nitroreductase family protein [Eubacteriales bacterium]|nr:nitroreductase family protein [Eubacteriales bacterium]
MDLMDILLERRSVRNYTEEEISEENLKKIIQAGLTGFSAKNRRPWELIVVRDKETLKKMAAGRKCGTKMLTKASAAIVVVANVEEANVWIEDCSIVMTYMHLMADSLGVGSCWVQGRLRTAPDGSSADDYMRNLLGYPSNYRLEATLALGMPESHPKAHTLEELPMEKVHWEKF